MNRDMSPKISILLPTHNKANLLSFAIRSVLSQSFQDFEVLVVGDGCTDNTADIVKGFNDPRLIWYDLPKAPNYGYANRNVALHEAQGDLIAYMAHDDLWLSDHLEKFLPLFNDPNLEIAYSRPLWVIPKGMIVPGLFNLHYKPSRNFFLEMGNRIPACCFVHRRDCFFNYGYWNDQLAEAADWDMWTRIIKGGYEMNFAYLDTPTSLHFKADWHANDYDSRFEFPTWRRLFASNQMPAALQIYIAEDTTEQEAIWQTISSMPMEWNKTIRSAVCQVIDLLAFQRISSDSKYQRIVEKLNVVKNTLKWKLRKKLTGNQWGQKLYIALKTPARNVFSKTKNK